MFHHNDPLFKLFQATTNNQNPPSKFPQTNNFKLTIHKSIIRISSCFALTQLQRKIKSRQSMKNQNQSCK